MMATISGLAGKPERSRGHERIPGWATNTVQSIDYGLLLEVEGYAAKIGGKSESDIVLATVAFDLEGSLNKWLLGHVGLLWEQDSRENDNIDEAYIAVGSVESTTFYFVGGRFYQPVGSFESAFISDPLTLEMTEMNKIGAMAGCGNDWFELNAGVFNGDVKKGVPADEGGDSTLSDFHAGISLTPAESMKLGAYWLSDLMEIWNLEQVGEQIANLPGYEKAGAAGAYMNLFLGRFTFNVEYVSALEDYSVAGGRYVPMAFSLEGSMQLGERIEAGLRYDASDDFYGEFDSTLPAFGEKIPGETAGIVVSYSFHESATVAMEYLHVEKSDDGAQGDIATVQLALEF